MNRISFISFFLLLRLVYFLEATSMEEKISDIYLQKALSTVDSDSSLLWIKKSLQYNPNSSDALYYLAKSIENLVEKRNYLEKAISEKNNWKVVPFVKGYAEYLKTLLNLGLYQEVVDKNNLLTDDQIIKSPDILYAYITSLKVLLSNSYLIEHSGQDYPDKLEKFVDMAWSYYPEDIRFWGFFSKREKFFLPFFAILKRLDIISQPILNSILSNLPNSLAERQAILTLLQNKVQNNTQLFVYLSLDKMTAQDEAINIIKKNDDLWDLKLHKAFFDSLQDPILKEDYKAWASSISGRFEWNDGNGYTNNNFLNISQGKIRSWQYKEGQEEYEVLFQDNQPYQFKSSNGLKVFYSVYPYVKSFSFLSSDLKGDSFLREEYHISDAHYSLPLFSSIFLSFSDLSLFAPLENEFYGPQIKRDDWISYLTRKEIYQSESLIEKSHYWKGHLTKKILIDPQTQKSYQTQLFEKGFLWKEDTVIDDKKGVHFVKVYPKYSSTYYSFLTYPNNLSTIINLVEPNKKVSYWDWFELGSPDILYVENMKNHTAKFLFMNSTEAAKYNNYLLFEPSDSSL